MPLTAIPEILDELRYDYVNEVLADPDVYFWVKSWIVNMWVLLTGPVNITRNIS